MDVCVLCSNNSTIEFLHLTRWIPCFTRGLGCGGCLPYVILQYTSIFMPRCSDGRRTIQRGVEAGEEVLQIVSRVSRLTSFSNDARTLQEHTTSFKTKTNSIHNILISFFPITYSMPSLPPAILENTWIEVLFLVHKSCSSHMYPKCPSSSCIQDQGAVKMGFHQECQTVHPIELHGLRACAIIKIVGILRCV